MYDDERWQRWVKGFREGDPLVWQEFWEQYGPMLHQIAAKHMTDRLARRVGPEDVVQSACRTFFRRGRLGQARPALGGITAQALAHHLGHAARHQR
jgi:hypothetical protein